MHRLQQRHGAVCGAVAALTIMLGASGTLLGAGEADLREQQQQYLRPGEIPFPAANSYSDQKSRLGRTLFFDPILSGPEVRSCASCHIPGLSWADGLARAVGERPLAVRTPTLLNVAWTPKLGWDGHFRDLEAVALGPITSPDNMNLPESRMLERLAGNPGYVALFNAAFGESGVTRRNVELALATFERTIVSDEAPFDHWIAGDENAIDAAAKRGFALFNGKADCAACHSGWAFTDASFHDVGSARNSDIGRGRLFPNSTKLQYAFKTPTLRNVARRGPYMHDGSLASLAAVVELYDRGGIDRPSRADEIHPLGLSDAEKADLVAFLRTLTGAPQQFSFPELPR